MLSEAVLQHLDKAGEQGRRTIYLRYVDDIKILAKTETDLRAKLDITSKEVGLFPQTYKINMRKVSDPEDEIKSVSRPLEPSVVPVIDQKKLTGRILELCRRGRVASSDSTRFKFLLAKVNPNHWLNARLMKVFFNPIRSLRPRSRLTSPDTPKFLWVWPQTSRDTSTSRNSTIPSLQSFLMVVREGSHPLLTMTSDKRHLIASCDLRLGHCHFSRHIRHH